MSLRCSLRLTFRGSCLQKEQGHQYTTGMGTAQVGLGCSAWFHAATFPVQDPHSTLDMRSDIRNIPPAQDGAALEQFTRGWGISVLRGSKDLTRQSWR